MSMPTALGLILCCLLAPSNITLYVVHLESPDYPDLARQAQLEGDVQVNLEIASDGRVVAATATTGPAILRREAEGNVRRWVFGGIEPTQKTTVAHVVVFEFRLEKERVAYVPKPRVVFDLASKVRIETKRTVVNIAKAP
jgi:hypothetical protein